MAQTNTPLMAMLAVFLGGACGEPPNEAPRSPAPIAVQDDLGRQVVLNAVPRRIASLAPGFTETLFAIGCGDRIAVRDRWSDHPDAARDLPAIDGLSPSAQQVAGFSPDLVLLYAVESRHVAPLEKLGIKVAVFNPARFDEVAQTIRRIGILAGCGEEARILADEMLREKERITAASSAAAGEGPLVYVEIDGADHARPWTAGPGSFVHELVALAGGQNAARDVRGAYGQVNAEAMIRTDPEWILLLDVRREDAGSKDADAGLSRFAGRPGWGETSAVRGGRVIDWIDRDLVSRPGPRLIDGLALLGEALGR